MRFVFVNSGTVRNNAGTIRCLGLSRELARMGHQVSFLLSDFPENREYFGREKDGISIVYATSGTGREQFAKTAVLASMGPIDVVHCMGIGSSVFLPALIIRRVFSRIGRLVVDFEDRQSLMVQENPWRFISYRFLERLAVRASDHIVCASLELTSVFSGSGKRILYLPFAVDPHPPGDHVQPSLARFFELCYIGNLTTQYEAQLIFLINCMKNSEFRDHPARLNIVGSGPLGKGLRQMAIDHGIDDRVRFYGFLDDGELCRLLRGMNALVLYLPNTPANRYRCPNKIFLYAATGLPIIANAVGEVARVLQDYPNVSWISGSDSIGFWHAVRRARRFKRRSVEGFLAANSWHHRTLSYLNYLFAEAPKTQTSREGMKLPFSETRGVTKITRSNT